MKRLVLILLLLTYALAARADMASVAPVPEKPASRLQLPPGFSISIFANLAGGGKDYFQGPRFMTFGPDGQLYVSLGMQNKVIMLPDRNHDGRADETVTVAEGLNGPQGLAFVGKSLHVANQDGVVRLESRDGHWPATGATPIISGLPTGGHTMKSLHIGPDGYLYLNVGSSCNVCDEQDPLRATMLRYSADGKPSGALASVGRHASSPIWASGLRNSQGFAWHPVSGELFATNNGADMRSGTRGAKPDDDLPPEHLNRIQPGKHYGWPHCWGAQVTDPNFPGPEGFCRDMEAPALQLPPHSTPIGIAFLDKAKVPADYRRDALVALHGSWNRADPSGYKIVRVRFEHDRPVGYSDFATGWLQGGSAWGRPVDIAVGPDGAIYVSDDRGGLIYRITYRKETP